MTLWVTSISLRWLKWSAAKPVQGRKSSCGPNCRPVTMPTCAALCCVSWVSTSQSCAMRCIQVPMFDTSEPAVHRR